MLRYFAYGANIDPDRMAARVPGVGLVGPGSVPGWQLEFTVRDREWGGGVANIRPAPGGRVWGVVWEADDEAFAVLDTYRGDAGGQRREPLDVDLAEATDGDADPVPAFTFRVHQIANYVKPTALYVAHLRRAMRRLDFPNDAFEALLAAERIGPTETGPSIVS
jgi:hypothetical protein